MPTIPGSGLRGLEGIADERLRESVTHGEQQLVTGQPDVLLLFSCDLTAPGRLMLAPVSRLDRASAESAFGYGRDATDQRDGPVVVAWTASSSWISASQRVGGIG